MSNKKLIPLMAGSMSLILVSSTVLVVSSFLVSDNNHKPKDVKPLNRGDNYEHFELTSYFKKYVDFEQISDYKIAEGKIIKVISKQKVELFFKNNMKNVLSKINKFKSKIDQYLFTINYQISPDCKSLLFDIVWSLPNSFFYYYDQLKLFII